MNASAIKAGVPVSLGGHLPEYAGLQAEVQATFALPDEEATLGVIIMADNDTPVGTTGMLFWFEYATMSSCGKGKAAASCIVVGSTNLSISSTYQRIMHDTSIGCCGSNVSNATGGYVSCQKRCDDDPDCVAWTFQPRPSAAASSSLGTCSLRNGLSNTAQTLWRGPVHSLNTTSGVKRPSLTLGGTRDILQLSASDRNLSIHVFVDNTMAEGFWQGGRVAMSRQCDPPMSLRASFYAYASAPVSLEEAEVWRMNDAWITKEEMLRTPRPDLQILSKHHDA
jgi:hypothetical protein